MRTNDQVKRKSIKIFRWFSGFHLLVPERKPVSFWGKKLEHTRDCIAVTIFVFYSVLKRYFRLVKNSPMLILTPGRITSVLDSYKNFGYVDRYLLRAVFQGKKLVSYCTTCNFHNYRDYTFDCDSDFWEQSEDNGTGICMECAGKTQQDWLEMLSKTTNEK